jgi:hypothetical protein
MIANSYRILFSGSTDREITLPVEIKWDFTGQDQSIDLYEDEVVKEVVGSGIDFEVNRFPHAPDPLTLRTDINYDFYFYSGGSLSNPASWNQNYISEGFTSEDIYYFKNNFTKSFFKLDFYDSVDTKSQVNYFTIIIPTQQGATISFIVANKNVNIKIPSFKLDYVGDKEGFFIYWLKKLEYVPINTFYMTAKFYNAEKGEFVKMMNKPQSSVNGDKYYFDTLTFYYYRVVCDYVNLNYSVYDILTNKRVGINTPISWYEYVNPPLV